MTKDKCLDDMPHLEYEHCWTERQVMHVYHSLVREILLADPHTEDRIVEVNCESSMALERIDEIRDRDNSDDSMKKTPSQIVAEGQELIETNLECLTPTTVGRHAPVIIEACERMMEMLKGKCRWCDEFELMAEESASGLNCDSCGQFILEGNETCGPSDKILCIKCS